MLRYLRDYTAKLWFVKLRKGVMTWQVSSNWENKPNISPIFGKCKENLGKYRQVGLTSIPRKTIDDVCVSSDTKIKAKKVNQRADDD